MHKRRAASIRWLIEHCDDCDDIGRLDDLSDCPKHTNFRLEGEAS